MILGFSESCTRNSEYVGNAMSQAFGLSPKSWIIVKGNPNLNIIVLLHDRRPSKKQKKVRLGLSEINWRCWPLGGNNLASDDYQTPQTICRFIVKIIFQ